MDPQQLIQVESLCQTLYTTPDASLRADANSRLLSLQTSSSNIPVCEFILDNSSNSYALIVASNSLTALITNHWNSYSVEERLSVRNYVLEYLASRGTTLTPYVSQSLIKLLCRITNLGWFDSPVHRELPTEIEKFLVASIEHCNLGLKILNQLVDELNIPATGRTLTQHRKTAVSFRDVSLFTVFQLGLTTLRQLEANQISADANLISSLGIQSIELCVRCLGFDFIGTNPDESAEDVGTIQVPSTWRLVISDSKTMHLFLHFYATTEPPRSSKAMEAVILLCSCRRSLFPTDKDRAQFLQTLMTGITSILKAQTGLHHQDNYHQFCRLLGRLKANYQLSELVKAGEYVEWLDLAGSFTCKSMENWQWSTNSIHYLLALWGRLVAAIPYVRPDTGVKGHSTKLETVVFTVVKVYIKSMLQSVAEVIQSDGSLDDPLDDDGSLKEQLERLPVICRFKYADVAKVILSHFDPIMVKYQTLNAMLGGSTLSEAQKQEMDIMEGQLTWLVYIIGAVVGGHSWSTTSIDDGDETIDASLSRRVLQLCQLVDYRCIQSRGVSKCDVKLEMAFLFYFQNFRRVYMFIWDSSMTSNNNSTPISTGGLSAIMGIGSSPCNNKSDNAPTTKQKVYQRMFDHMGMGDHTSVANLIVTKISNNLKFWPAHEDVIGVTLELFLDMASGYSSSKLLLTLETVRYLLVHHTSDNFPFLAVAGNVRHRTTFHATLTRLLFSAGTEEAYTSFESFLAPILDILTRLSNLSNQELRSENVKGPLIGVLRDLRGIASSLHNRRAFLMLFDSLYPSHFPLLVRIAEVWFDDPGVMTSLLKFEHEFVHNKANRINFDQSSPNGILLFRATSDVICAYANRILSNVSQAGGNSLELYKLRYKGYSLAFDVFFSALSGNYVCFGVFALYNDPALDNALDTALKLILSVPLDDILVFPKLSKSYYQFLEILFRSHIGTVMSLETSVLMNIMNAIHEGLQSSDAPLSSQCATTIDHIATFYFTNSQLPKTAQKPEALQLVQHINAQPNLFSSLTATLFNLLLFGSPANHWSVMRPMLSLMLSSEVSFTSYKQTLMLTQTPEKQSMLEDAFGVLLKDVMRNLEPGNRDRFTQKLTMFRVSTRAFLTL